MDQLHHDLSPAPPGSDRERDDRYYELLAGITRTRLFEGFVDLQLPELLGTEGPMTAATICDQLGLHQDRGWKFLHLLAWIGLLDEEDGEYGGDSAVYSMTEWARQLFGDDGKGGE